VKIRFQETGWAKTTQVRWADFPHAFAYGNFLDEQIKVSAGRLGDSPWGMGGPEKWDTLDEELNTIAIRTEFKPAFVPGLNVGFVLNDWNNGIPIGKADENILSLLQESILGASYDHKYFGIRLAYRLDSTADKNNTTSFMEESNEGEELIYRVEERLLQTLLPGFQIWANGHYKGINCGSAFELDYTNWLYVEYAPAPFTAQFRLGYDTAGSEKDGKREVLHARGSFYYNILSFLSAGVSGYYAQDYGLKKSPDSPFSEWSVEPKVKVTFGDSYTELVYHYGSEYTKADVEEKTHWVNLRLVFTF
jgi:hypothetical protein